MSATPPTPSGSLENQKFWEVARVFFKLGLTAFGGPAAHIAYMHQEVVRKRHWVSDQQFLDLLGATNLIPGPNSTEMAIHLGYVRAGWRGMLAGGLGFILPAAMIVLLFSVAYVQFGSTPQAEWLLYGIKPVILAIIVHALYALGQKAVTGWTTALVGIGSIVLYILGVNELLLLFGCGGLLMLWRNRQLIAQWGKSLPPAAFMLAGMYSLAGAEVPFSLWRLFLIFLKIGSVLYGSGYVLLAFMRADLVERLGWLTNQQLIDAIAIGQITPGPLFTSATFVGYLLGGIPGALVATVGIFLPSFFFVAISNPIIPRMRASTWLAAMLDGINVAALGLMVGVMGEISLTSLTDTFTILLGVVSTFLLFRYNFNPTWLILTGALLGMLRNFITP